METGKQSPSQCTESYGLFFKEVEQISEEQRKSMVNALIGHIAQSEAVYDKAPTKH